jgi:hypothetical protein
MTDDPTPDRSINVEVHDMKDSQLAAGEGNTQTIQTVKVSAPPSAEELKELAAAFDALKAQVERDAPPEVREEAIRQADALQQATISERPNVSVMAAAKQWFLAHAPGLLGAVTAVVINPIVGTIVGSAGDAIAKEYQKWFPEAEAAQQS